MVKRRKRAIVGDAYHDRLWKEFSQDIPQQHIDGWRDHVEKWEQDTSSVKDPYYLAPTGESSSRDRLPISLTSLRPHRNSNQGSACRRGRRRGGSWEALATQSHPVQYACGAAGN